MAGWMAATAVPTHGTVPIAMPCLPAAAAAGDHSGAIWLWDPATGKPLGQCRVGGWVRESGRAGGWGGGVLGTHL